MKEHLKRFCRDVLPAKVPQSTRKRRAEPIVEEKEEEEEHSLGIMYLPYTKDGKVDLERTPPEYLEQARAANEVATIAEMEKLIVRATPRNYSARVMLNNQK